MRFARLALAALALLSGPTGTIRGRITIHKKDGSDKKDYSEVVVYVADWEAPVHARAQVVQKDRQFVPRVLAVAAGTRVAFPNADAIEHNVFSHSAVAEFDLGRFQRGEKREVEFKQAGVAEIFCNVHKNMIGYVVVAPGPAFAVTGADGAVELRGVPAGRHRIAIWERFARPKLQEIAIDVPAGGVAPLPPVDIREQVDLEPSHKNKFGTDYPKTW